MILDLFSFFFLFYLKSFHIGDLMPQQLTTCLCFFFLHFDLKLKKEKEKKAEEKQS